MEEDLVHFLSFCFLYFGRFHEVVSGGSLNGLDSVWVDARHLAGFDLFHTSEGACAPPHH